MTQALTTAAAEPRLRTVGIQQIVVRRHVVGAVIKVVLVLLLPLLGRFISLGVGSAAHASVFVLLVAWTLKGPRQAVEALTLSWLATFLNPGLYSLSSYSEVLRWLVIAGALASVLLRVGSRGSTVPRAWFWLAAFVVTASMLALQASYAPDVSLFKLVSFFMGATAVLLGFHQTRHEAAYWRIWFVTLFAVMVTASFPLIVHPLGYLRNGRGFQGLTGQPQTYTLFLGPMLAWVVARLITRRDRGAWMWVLAAIGTISLIATLGRTGVLAMGSGLGLAALWWVLTGRIQIRLPKVWLGLLLLGAAAGGAWLVMHMQEVTEAAVNFVLKGKTDADIDAAFHASRGFLIEASMANFQRNPLTGIGFGVASDPSSFIIRRDPVLGLPVSASTEKGFIAAAILEEVGLIGAAVFILMLGALLRPVLGRSAAFPSTVLALSALMVNVGEAVFFAVGGSGILVWLLIGAARVMAMEEQ